MEIKVIRTGPLEVNTYIVPLADNDVFVVDPADCHFSGDRLCVVKYLEENKLDPKAVILTHGHFDHVSGIKDFKSAYPDVPILINSGDKDFIGEKSAELQGRSLVPVSFGEFLSEVTDLPSPDAFLDDGKLLSDLECLSKSSAKTMKALSQWKIIGTPGHSPGSICLYNADEKVLISGDTIFYRSYGRTDLPLGSEAKIRKSLSELEKSIPPETLVYPGHDDYGFLMGRNSNFLDY